MSNKRNTDKERKFSSDKAFSWLLDLLEYQGTGGSPVNVELARSWEDNIFAVLDSTERLNGLTPKQQTEVFYDRKRIDTVYRSGEILTTQPIIMKDAPITHKEAALWLLKKIEGNDERQIRAGIFEMLVFNTLFSMFGTKIAILDKPGQRTMQDKTTDLAIIDQMSVELKAISGQGPEAVRDNIIKADSQHKATIALKQLKKLGITFVLLPQDSLEALQNQQDQSDYLQRVIDEISLTFAGYEGQDPLSHTGAIILVIESFKETEVDGKRFFEHRLEMATYVKPGSNKNDILPPELCPPEIIEEKKQP